MQAKLRLGRNPIQRRLSSPAKASYDMLFKDEGPSSMTPLSRIGMLAAVVSTLAVMSYAAIATALQEEA